MRRLVRWALLIPVAAAIVACTDPMGVGRSHSDGVEVGNGAIRRHLDREHKFWVELPTGVRANATAPRTTVFSDPEGGTMRFQVYPRGQIGPDRIRTLAELRALAKRACGDDELQTIQFHGTPGFTCRKGSTGLAWLLTLRNDAIAIDWRMRDREWQKTLLTTFTFDDAPPVVLRLETNPASVPDGSSFRLLIKAVDDSAGLADLVEGSLFPIGGKRENARSFHAKIEKSPNEGWMQAFVTVGRGLPLGPYCVESFRIRDGLANTMSLAAIGCPQKDGQLLPYRANGAASRIRPPRIEIRSPKTSAPHLPDLRWVRFASPKSISGGIAVLLFQLQSAPADQRRTIFSRHWGEIVPSFPAPYSARVQLKNLFAEAIDQMGTYRITITLPTTLPGGEYRLDSFRLRGEDGKVISRLDTDESSPSIYADRVPSILVPTVDIVAASSEIDVMPPTIFEVGLLTPSVPRGGTGILLFRAEDDVSGIPNGTIFAGKWTPLGWKGLKWVLRGGIRNLGNGWHSLVFHVDEGAKAGNYFLEAFRLDDRAGNGTLLKGDLRVTPEAHYSLVTEGAAPRHTDIAIPVLKVVGEGI